MLYCNSKASSHVDPCVVQIHQHWPKMEFVVQHHMNVHNASDERGRSLEIIVLEVSAST